MKAILALFLAVAATSSASVLLDVSLGTQGLLFNPPGPFYLAFQLADGSGIGNGNNSITLSNFQFGGDGSAAGSPILIGSATGSLATSVVLTDSTPTNIFIESFTSSLTPAYLLSFRMELTTNLEAVTPDEFIISILDNTLSPLETTSSNPLFPILAISIDSLNPTIDTFGKGGFQIDYDFAAPVVTLVQQPPTSGVPEPSSIGLTIAGMACLGIRKLRR